MIHVQIMEEASLAGDAAKAKYQKKGVNAIIILC